MPRSNIFDGNGTHVAAGFTSVTSSEQAAIQAGIVAPGQQLRPQCPSGNCNFPAYGTIAYCSSCVDVSDSINISFQNLTNNNITTTIPGVSTSIPGLDIYFVADGQTSNFSTFGITEEGYQFLVGLPLDWTATGVTVGPYDPATGGKPQGCDNVTTNQTWRCHGTGAANCQLYPCIRTYEASVTNGAVAETLIDETSRLPPLFGYGGISTYASTLNATCLTDSESDFLSRVGYVANDTQQWIPYNLTGYIDSREPFPVLVSNDTSLWDFERAIKQRGCLYAIEHEFPDSLVADYLSIDWPGVLVGHRNAEGGGIANFEGPQILQTLYNFGDFGFERTQSLFKNVSDSLTDHMRSNPGNSNFTDAASDPFNFTAPAGGTVYQNRTCLVVRWPWLALPAALVILTLLFFAIVLIEQRGVTGKVRTWVSSPLPLFFFGPDTRLSHHPRDASSRAGAQELESVEQASKQIMVQLVTTGGPHGISRLEAHAASMTILLQSL